MRNNYRDKQFYNDLAIDLFFVWILNNFLYNKKELIEFKLNNNKDELLAEMSP